MNTSLVYLLKLPNYCLVTYSGNISEYLPKELRDACMSYVFDNVTKTVTTGDCEKFVYSTEYFTRTIVTDVSH